MDIFWRLVGGIAAALPCFLMAQRLFKVWRDPMSVEGGAWVRYGVGLMITEFVVIHCGAFVGGAATQMPALHMKGLIVVTLLYGCIAGVIAFVFKSRGLLAYFAFIMAGRLLTIAVPMLREDSGYIITRVVVAIVLFMATMTLTIIPLPRGGITPEILKIIPPLPKQGDWDYCPHRFIVAGILYFFLMGCAEILVSLKVIYMEGSGASW